MRSYAADPDGRVFALQLSEEGSEVVEVIGRSQLPAEPASRFIGNSVSDGAREAGKPSPGRIAPSSDAPISRDEILRRAAAYATTSWALSESNYQKNRESICVPEKGKKWVRPRSLEGKLNQLIVGLPYNWGGKDSLDSFQRKIHGGAPAGNVCTCRRADYDYCVINEAAGVDCSGLASRVWGISPTGTEGLAAVGRPKNSLSELRPGDILDRPGNHVRVFVSLVRIPEGIKIRAYESSLQCQGVCVRDFALAEFDGYRFYAPPFLQD